MSNKPICVRRTSTLEEASIIVAWLAEQGVEATILDPENAGLMFFGVTDIEGIAICVADEDTAAQAAVLLEEHDQRHATAPEGKGTVMVLCEKCGTQNEFRTDQRDSVQDCGECGAYVDVPAA